VVLLGEMSLKVDHVGSGGGGGRGEISVKRIRSPFEMDSECEEVINEMNCSIVSRILHLTRRHKKGNVRPEETIPGESSNRANKAHSNLKKMNNKKCKTSSSFFRNKVRTNSCMKGFDLF
jgi:hypothetical protein